jgi:hypothetical protein
VQAELFNAAALVAGPHGAAFANALFCARGASLLEFHRLLWTREPNSPLYAQLSRLLGLRHWVLVDERTPEWQTGARGRPEKQGYHAISPAAVVGAARAALDAATRVARGADEARLGSLVELANFIPEASHKVHYLL